MSEVLIALGIVAALLGAWGYWEHYHYHWRVNREIRRARREVRRIDRQQRLKEM